MYIKEIYNKIMQRFRGEKEVFYHKVLKLCVKYRMIKQTVSAKKTTEEIKHNHKQYSTPKKAEIEETGKK